MTSLTKLKILLDKVLSQDDNHIKQFHFDNFSVVLRLHYSLSVL